MSPPIAIRTNPNTGQMPKPSIAKRWEQPLSMLNCFSKTPGESFQTASNFESGKAESVFIAGMYVLYGKEFAEILKRINKSDEANSVLADVKTVEEATIKYGWDGEWFMRGWSNLR